MGNFKIKEFRKAKGLFQGEMAEMIGLTQSNLSRYETTGVDLTDEMLDKLREKFGKESVDAFLTDSAELARENTLPDNRRDELTILDLVTIIKKQNETIRQQIDIQNECVQKLASMNERLFNLLEKIQFD